MRISLPSARCAVAGGSFARGGGRCGPAASRRRPLATRARHGGQLDDHRERANEGGKIESVQHHRQVGDGWQRADPRGDGRGRTLAEGLEPGEIHPHDPAVESSNNMIRSSTGRFSGGGG
jgi:hypothetical protein